MEYNIDDLPLEVQFYKVSKWIPLKDLINLRKVSKSYNSLIPPLTNQDLEDIQDLVFYLPSYHFEEFYHNLIQDMYDEIDYAGEVEIIIQSKSGKEKAKLNIYVDRNKFTIDINSLSNQIYDDINVANLNLASSGYINAILANVFRNSDSGDKIKVILHKWDGDDTTIIDVDEIKNSISKLVKNLSTINQNNKYTQIIYPILSQLKPKIENYKWSLYDDIISREH